MQITLKNVKHYAAMSEETNCFEATLYIDGKKVCEVSNHGQGGPNEYSDWAVARRIDEYAKTLPAEDVTFGDKTVTIYQSADSLVDNAFEAAMKAKDEAKFRKMAQKDYTTRVCFERDGAMRTTKTTTPETAKVWMQSAVAKGESPLNLLPFDEFFATWMRLVVKTA